MDENKGKVLIVDDEKGIRDMISYALKSLGYDVLDAENGINGLKLINETDDIDAVITDMKMPCMEGLAFLQKVKEAHPAIQVIVATGFAAPEEITDGRKKGAYEYVNKPFEIKELVSIVGRAVELKRLKIQIVKLQESEKLKDEFIASIAHDLKTPLTAISGVVDIFLSNGTEDGDIPDNNKNTVFFDVIKRNVDRMRILANNLLDFSRMEDNATVGVWKLANRPVSAAKLMEQAVKEINPIAMGKKIKLIMNESLAGETKDASDSSISCDSSLIHRVLSNYISNAIKFSNNSGRIAVWFKKDAGEAKFCVEDNGIGIPKEQLEKIFDRYYCHKTTDRPDDFSCGLGLYICKKIVELHGGKVWAESEGEDKGSRFFFTLPPGKI